MKIVRLLLILLVPALGIVGCQKSTIKPGCPGNSGSERSTTPQDDNNASVGARTANYSDGTSVDGEDSNDPTDIIGSGGDDDREGGKKTKNGAK